MSSTIRCRTSKLYPKMKIEVTTDWPFYSAYHRADYIPSHDNRKTVVLREPRESRVYRLENPSQKELVVYKIDGGLISSNDVLKCDNGIYTEDDTLYLIELKGADYIHALEQLLSTISILLQRPQVKVSKLFARIVLSKIRVPAIIPTQEKKLLAQVHSRNGNFDKKCQTLCERI